MRSAWLVAILALAGVGIDAADDRPISPPKRGAGADVEATRPLSTCEQAIRDLGDTFTKAFDTGDAKAIAALYAPDAHMIDRAGEVFEGRQAIEKEYARLFKENPGLKLECCVEEIRLLGPDAAIEDGLCRGIPKEGGPWAPTRYTVVYVKRDGRWLMASDRESPGEESASIRDRLKELEWMVGDWVDEADDSIIETSCRWSDDKTHLIRDFTIRVRGQVALTGTQRIGWDAPTGQIKAWVFDSEGSRCEELWARLGNQWIIKATGVLPDGCISTATHVLIQEDPQTCRWRTVDRTVGSDVIPDIMEFTMVRKPPQPGTKPTAPAH
jgi:uncharacterized protein (TIGR02246 family)